MNKVLSLMGFAAKSRNLLTGYNTCSLQIQKNKIKVIILAEDLADNSKEKMVGLCKREGVKFYEFSTMEELSHITGKSNSGIFGITDEGFGAAISKEIDSIQSTKEAE